MGFWEIIVPEEETNYVRNPSFELGTTGYTVIGGSISRGSSGARRGGYGLTINPTAGTTDGVYYTLALDVGTYAVSVDIKGVLGVPYKIYGATEAGTPISDITTFTGTGDWQRVYALDFSAAGTDNYRIYITKNNSANTDSFYIDGLQCSDVNAETTYVDGDQKGCEWFGEHQNSISTRDGQERSGGRIYDLDDLGIKIIDEPGIGMPPISHLVQGRSFFPGSNYLGQKIKERVLTIVFQAKGTSLSNLHSIRKTIIDYIKNDRVSNNQPFILRYLGADSNKPLILSCVYDSGLEWTDVSAWGERIAMRVIAYDPFFHEDGNGVKAITPFQSISNANYVLKRIDGVWSNISSQFNGTTYAVVEAKDGSIYIGGSFTNVTLPQCDYILRYFPNEDQIQALTTGLNGDCYAIAVAPNGDVYVGGAFTSAGGVANTARIAKWNGSAWSAVGTGISSGAVGALAWGFDGTLYIGGSFTNHGDANGDYITKWNGSAYSSLGTGMNDTVFDLAISPNGDLIASGLFTTAGGTAAVGIAKWNGTAWSNIGDIADGLGTTVGNCLRYDKAGNLYLGGDFRSISGVSALRVAKYNGVSWEALGTGLNGYVQSMDIDKNGLLYVGGVFTEAGELDLADRMAVWNGSTWSHIDINLPGNPVIQDILFTNTNDLYIGYDSAGSAVSSNLVTLTNEGTVTTYPLFYVTFSGSGSATLEWLKNETTNKTLYCNYSLLNGEILVVNLDPDDRKIESNFFGNVIGRAILRNSDFADFNLLPGDNEISAFVTTSGSFSMISYLTYPIIYWSADGGS